MADVYFHSGFYPTMFDVRKKEGPTHLDVASHNAAEEAKAEEPDEDDNFMGKPKDWIEKLGRNFFPTNHTHLEGANAREFLPWLKLSAEMDPHLVGTYVTAAYWLRTRLNKPDEAEQFLREGLRANPDSDEILLELGRVYFYDKKDLRVARNIWELALNKWHQRDQAGQDPNPHAREEILGELVRADQQSGDLKKLLVDLEELVKISPNKSSVEKYIEEVKAKLVH
jgi:tetratricopeptide (TPR) repeat protein